MRACSPSTYSSTVDPFERRLNLELQIKFVKNWLCSKKVRKPYSYPVGEDALRTEDQTHDGVFSSWPPEMLKTSLPPTRCGYSCVLGGTRADRLRCIRWLRWGKKRPLNILIIKRLFVKDKSGSLSLSLTLSRCPMVWFIPSFRLPDFVCGDPKQSRPVLCERALRKLRKVESTERVLLVKAGSEFMR